MERHFFFSACALLLLAASTASDARIVEHTFFVQNLTVNKLCNTQIITAVNGRLPGPTIRVQEGDTHGVFQRLSGWADGPSMITQCPIRPGCKYIYKFTIIDQEGTLWWHAHVSFLRATVYGALIIRPRDGHSYPFPMPYKEVPILLGEWWNTNVFDVEKLAVATGAAPNLSIAYTINGWPGDLYPCSENRTL
ncbi:laccase-7-like [Gossypium australe]|uniref:Laccase-7-like n=1 Tax=Gossypium australe TaxID=47621 RepID=A0A5B6X0G4_9ROSI|nr:laccase-7-like [Gossypium australe]